MHRRELLAAGGKTMTDNLHIAFTIIIVFLMVLVMAFGATLFGKGFRVYSIVSLSAMVVFGLLAARSGPLIEDNQPTPMAGVWERISISLFLVWIAIVSVRLLAIQPESQKKS